MKYAITHPGTAHGDDFLAACVIAAKFDCPIYRREPTQQELEDDEVLVFDIGGKYEPERLNFDHHQDLSIQCSLVLVLKHLGLHDKFQRAYRWYENVDFRDRHGMKALGERYNLTDEQMLELNSPAHTGMISLFEKRERVSPESRYTGEMSPLYSVLSDIGLELIVYAEKYDSAYARLESCEIQNFCGHEVLINPSDDLTATADFIRKNNISIAASYDNRGDGWAILRCADGESSFDFSRIAGDARIVFAHKAGFIAKTKERLAIDEVFELIGLSQKI